MRTSVGSHSDGGEFLRKLHRYESQPLDTHRCNYCYQVGAFRRWRTAPGSIVKGLKPCRGVACYRELPRILLLRLSEKGYKQHSGGEFGWCRAGEIGRNTPLRRPGELRCRLLQGFSDSLSRQLGE